MAKNDFENALRSVFESPNVSDSNMEPANIVDVGARIARSISRLALSITPGSDVSPGHDEAGGTVTSLTEAVMGITSGLFRIADAMGRIAEAIETMSTSEERPIPPRDPEVGSVDEDGR